MPRPLPEMVPLLVMPPEKVVRLKTSMPNLAAIKPALVMPPAKVETVFTEMPVALPLTVIVPALLMPPPKVGAS